jgi:biopolymer transport protein ExbB
MAAEAKSLEELINTVLEQRAVEKQQDAERERQFLQEHNRQQALLAEAKDRFAQEEARNQRLRADYDSNEQTLTQQEETLNNAKGDLGELSGVVQQVAGDFRGILESSLVSAQKPGRAELPKKLTLSRDMPSMEELEGLWHLMLDEIHESGRVVKFKADVVAESGKKQSRDIIRVGVFNAVSGGEFLRYVADTGELALSGRQPPGRFQRMAEDLEQADLGLVEMAVDPSKGALLSILVRTPDLWTRVKQGRWGGAVIIALGIIALAIGIERYVLLGSLGRKMQQQIQSPRAETDNPLGRVIKVYTDSRGVDPETLGLKLDEAVLKELPVFRKRLGFLAVIAGVAPLLGLLGTVTGIIKTFEAITLFGTGDPRVMSSGISEALVSTVLGLVAAIPAALVHSVLSEKSNRLVQILDEQSAAMVARLAESRHAETVRTP